VRILSGPVSLRPPKGALALAFLAIAGLSLLALPTRAGAHAERESFFPDHNQGAFPEYRTTGPSLVVCKPESRRLIGDIRDKHLRKENTRLLRKCGFSHIQAAVNAAGNNARIQVLPGTYREEPSRGPAPAGCEDVYQRTANGDYALTYDEHRQCPHAQNLIAILGDTNDNRICDAKCNLQIEGTGDDSNDVRIEGEKTALNVIRADRADGVFLKNFYIEFSDFNNIYVLETNGFRIDGIISRYSREYGILSFTSDHGIYENCEASHSGDSGVYPGSGPNARHGQPDAHGHVYGIIIRNCDSHSNAIGTSGTAGNGTLFEHNRFHDNATGVTVDSFNGGHPGMPQDNSKWSENLIYDNNNDLYNAERDAYCATVPWEERDPELVCPTFGVPLGTGVLIAGGNANLIQNNYIFDNWRNGTMQFWVPAALRDEQDPAKTYDTSGNNRYQDNCMGVRPSSLDPGQVNFTACQGTSDLNGTDFWWDEEEGQDCSEEESGCVDTDSVLGNCWVQSGTTRNEGPGGASPTSDPNPPLLPDCPGIDLFRPGNNEKQAFLVPCATWSPENPDPPGCDWFTPRPEPN
jgi:hypothetical protein